VKNRWLPLVGILGVAFIVAAFAIGGETPDADETAQKAVDFYVKNDTDQLISAILLAYGALALLGFSSVLRNALRTAEGAGAGASTFGFAGAILYSLGMALFGGITFTLADVADKLDPSAVQALNALNSDFFLPLALGTCAFLLGMGISIIRTGALPKWLGWVAVVLAVIAITPLGFFAFLASGIWVIIASIVLSRRAGAATA
jgi:hypothetical protein